MSREASCESREPAALANATTTETSQADCSIVTAQPEELTERSLASVDDRILWMERLLRIRTKAGGLAPLRANAAQLAFEQQHRRESIVLKARQMGMSTWIAARFFLRALVVPGTVTVHAAHTREAATAMFRLVQRMWANLPDPLRQGRGKLLRNNAGEMVFAGHDSEVRIVSAAEPNAGRGLTMHHLHVSELSRWQGDAAETLAGLRAALAPGGELVVESTPNGAFGCFYNEWVAAERNGVCRHFFPWWMEPGYVSSGVVDDASLTEDERRLMAAVPLSAEQIAFRRELQDRFGPLAAQEFAEDAHTCFRESGACLFETRPLLERMEVLAGPIATRWNGAMQIFLPPVAGRRYAVAVDPAGGMTGGDWSAMQVIDRETGVQCAEVQARWNPRQTAQRAAEMAREYNDALLVVERNNHGHAVLAHLENEAGLRLYKDADGAAGWLTTSASRDSMLGALQVLVSTRTALLNSRRLLEECRSFVERNGRAEAAAGAHDDLVMAMAIAQAVK